MRSTAPSWLSNPTRSSCRQSGETTSVAVVGVCGLSRTFSIWVTFCADFLSAKSPQMQKWPQERQLRCVTMSLQIISLWTSPPTLSLLTICSYVLRMLCASLYLIMALSRRFSSIRIFRVSGESSRFGFRSRRKEKSGHEVAKSVLRSVTWRNDRMRVLIILRNSEKQHAEGNSDIHGGKPAPNSRSVMCSLIHRLCPTQGGRRCSSRLGTQLLHIKQIISWQRQAIASLQRGNGRHFPLFSRA